MRFRPQVTILIGVFALVFIPIKGRAESLKTREVQHKYRLLGGISFANSMSREAQRQLPWRQIERSTLAPLRVDYELSYDWGESALWQLRAGARLLRVGLEGELSAVRPLRDPRGRGLALGEVSLIYGEDTQEFVNRLMVKVGMFTLSLNHVKWDQLGDRSAPLLESSLWSMEDPTWSESASILDRFVTGVSLRGGGGEERLMRWAYRLSLATPSEGKGGPFSQMSGGLLLDVATALRSRSWRAGLNSLFGGGLALSEATRGYVDDQLSIASALGRHDLLSDRELYRDVLWVRAQLEREINIFTNHQLFAFSLFESRKVWFKKGELSALDVAALSESNLIGSGDRFSIGMRGERRQRGFGPRVPDTLRLAYEWRDPHLHFAYDERHRVRMSLAYQGEVSTISLWWVHPWSAAENRFRFDHDWVGISLLFSQ